MKFNNIHIKGYSRCLPHTAQSNTTLGYDDKWIQKNLGIKSRRISMFENVADIGAWSGERAITYSMIDRKAVDAVIVSCSSPSHFAPSVSSQIIHKLGIHAPAFDINAVCSGFVYAMEMGCHMINSGGYENILVIATEAYSAITDYDNRDCVYFGDGAGAVMLSKGEGTIYTNIWADGESGDAFVVKAGEKFSMIGKKVSKRIKEKLPIYIEHALAEADITTKDVDVFIPHHAAKTVLDALCKDIRMPLEKTLTVMEKFANLASASIPIALCEVADLKDKTILMAAIGSGWTYGTVILQL